MAVLWHPDAKRHPILGRPGKPWAGGQGNPKYLFHTTEITTRWPNYSSPPHLTLNPWTGELRQHVAFTLAAYSVRSSRVDEMQYTYQVEHWGKAKDVPTYPDHWYRNVAALIQWLHDNLDVPLVFDDFTNLRFGPLGSRLPYDQVDDFSGIIGHGRVGRGIDTHWDPGALDVPRLEAMLEAIAPPPPPPEEKMTTRQDKADDGQAVHAINFQAAIDAGVMSTFTQPGGVAFNDEIATFLARANVYKIVALEARIAALEASSSEDEVARLAAAAANAEATRANSRLDNV